MAKETLLISVELPADFGYEIAAIRDRMEQEELDNYLQEVVLKALEAKWQELVDD